MCQHSVMSLRRDQPRPTELLIVGVAHLDASIPDAALERGVGLLRNWRPDLIAVECLPGHLVVEYEDRGGIFTDFPVGDAPHARRGAATVADLRPWTVWRARAVARDSTAALTDRAIGWLLAREPNNSLLLPWQDANLPPGACEFLSRLANSPSERVRVGVRLARELGHTELVHFDDHAGVEILDQLPNLMDAVNAHYRAVKDEQPQPPYLPALSRTRGCDGCGRQLQRHATGSKRSKAPRWQPNPIASCGPGTPNGALATSPWQRGCGKPWLSSQVAECWRSSDTPTRDPSERPSRQTNTTSSSPTSPASTRTNGNWTPILTAEGSSDEATGECPPTSMPDCAGAYGSVAIGGSSGTGREPH